MELRLDVVQKDELQDGVADLDLVPLAQLDRLDAGGVDEGVIGAAEIDDRIGRRLRRGIPPAVEAGVLARHQVVGDPDLDVEAAADDHRAPEQAEIATDLRPL